MKAPTLIIFVVTATAWADTINFDDVKAGTLPANWLAAQTGSGAAKWDVEMADDAPSKPNVLKQSGIATFPVCIKRDTNVENGFVAVKFKPVAGKEDQAGGVIWRCKDKDNYYVARANALENNVTIYHTINGQRVAFKSVKQTVKPGNWHSLRVDFERDEFTVTFDGKKVIKATDESFKGTGKVGLWTKADSLTLFDDFSYDEK
jgi:3-keto-disaccharide hydrolase